jgi:hypothetical protein
LSTSATLEPDRTGEAIVLHVAPTDAVALAPRFWRSVKFASSPSTRAAYRYTAKAVLHDGNEVRARKPGPQPAAPAPTAPTAPRPEFDPGTSGGSGAAAPQPREFTAAPQAPAGASEAAPRPRAATGSAGAAIGEFGP